MLPGFLSQTPPLKPLISVFLQLDAQSFIMFHSVCVQICKHMESQNINEWMSKFSRIRVLNYKSPNNPSVPSACIKNGACSFPKSTKQSQSCSSPPTPSRKISQV